MAVIARITIVGHGKRRTETRRYNELTAKAARATLDNAINAGSIFHLAGKVDGKVVYKKSKPSKVRIVVGDKTVASFTKYPYEVTEIMGVQE